VHVRIAHVPIGALMLLDMHLRSYLCAYLCTSQPARIYVRTCRAHNILRVLIEVLPHVPFTPLLLEGLLTQQIDLPSGNGLSLCFLSLSFSLSLFFIYIYTYILHHALAYKSCDRVTFIALWCTFLIYSLLTIG